MEINQQPLVSRTGLVHSTPSDPEEKLSENEIELCKEWLVKFAKRKNRRPGECVNSYYLKHVIEEAVDKYVPNGAAIQAALNLGFRYRADDGPNAYFHMELLLPEDDWKRVKPGGFSRWLFRQPGMLGSDAKDDPDWPRTAMRFIDFWRYLKCRGLGKRGYLCRLGKVERPNGSATRLN